MTYKIGTFTKGVLAATALTVCSLGSAPFAIALDKVTVGKAVPFAWTFTPMEVGRAAGIWKKYGIEVKILGFAGDAKMQQGLASGSIDFGLGSGPGMGFSAKGVPAKAVAAFAGLPKNISVVIRYDSPIKSIADLKGKRIGVTTVGSLTDWLAKRMAITQGWKPTDITTVTLGGFQSMRAAIKTKQVDALMFATEVGYMLEAKKEAKNLVNTAQFVSDFHTHVIFARNEMIEKKSDVVQRFLKGWFATIAFMKANKDETVKITAKVLRQSPEIMSRTYDEEISMMSDDGVFDPKAIAVLKKSFIEMGILKEVPKDEVLFTKQFVPVKP